LGANNTLRTLLVLLWTHEQQLHRLGPKRSSDLRVKSDERRVLERGPKKEKKKTKNKKTEPEERDLEDDDEEEE
jgi:hypothetical protein